jgi:hypothetical protein
MKPYLYPNGRAHTRKSRTHNKKLILFILFILLVILSFAQTGSVRFSSGSECAVQQIVKTK